jgi:hypothetical protein
MAEEVLSIFGDLRLAIAELKQATSRAVRLYWLANHTQGANWDTVAQLVHREGVDTYMAAVTDGYTPIATWDKRVAVAMKEALQERHLAKDGTPLGPLCPKLQRRRSAVSSAIGASAAQSRGGRERSSGDARTSRGRGRAPGSRAVGRAPHTARAGNGCGARPAAARPAAPGAAAAAAAGAGAAGGP